MASSELALSASDIRLRGLFDAAEDDRAAVQPGDPVVLIVEDELSLLLHHLLGELFDRAIAQGGELFDAHRIQINLGHVCLLSLSVLATA